MKPEVLKLEVWKPANTAWNLCPGGRYANFILRDRVVCQNAPFSVLEAGSLVWLIERVGNSVRIGCNGGDRPEALTHILDACAAVYGMRYKVVHATTFGPHFHRLAPGTVVEVRGQLPPEAEGGPCVVVVLLADASMHRIHRLAGLEAAEVASLKEQK